MYKVIIAFKDLETNHIYRAGDIYPAPNLPAPSDKRIADLLSGENLRRQPLIVALPEAAAPLQGEPKEVAPAQDKPAQEVAETANQGETEEVTPAQGEPAQEAAETANQGDQVKPRVRRNGK